MVATASPKHRFVAVESPDGSWRRRERANVALFLGGRWDALAPHRGIWMPRTRRHRFNQRLGARPVVISVLYDNGEKPRGHAYKRRTADLTNRGAPLVYRRRSLVLV